MNSNDKIEALQILLEGAVALIKVIKKQWRYGLRYTKPNRRSIVNNNFNQLSII